MTKRDGARRPTILVADDNPQIVELLEAYLEPLDVALASATDGQDVFAKVERDPPDLILLDVMMPRVSGFEVCRTLKADPRYRHIPIIMVTALNELGDEERAREFGCDDFLCKPVNKMELLARVANLLRLRRDQRAGGARSGPDPLDS